MDQMVILPAGSANSSLMAHEMVSGSGSGPAEVVQFAAICVAHQTRHKRVFQEYIYPVGVAVSMSCLVATFLLYSVLPQLRDLTGKFILGICATGLTALALTLIDVFGWKDANVDKLATELVLHTTVVGAWLCLNSMGHHVSDISFYFTESGKLSQPFWTFESDKKGLKAHNF